MPAPTRRAARLTPLRGTNEQLVCTAKVGVGARFTTVYLPNSDAIHYIVAPRNGAEISVLSADFQIERLGRRANFVARLRAAMIFKRKKIVIFPHFRIFAVGPKSDRKTFSATVRRMMRSGAALDGPVIQKHPELLLGWKERPKEFRPVARPPDCAASAAIVVHIYYEETWGEIATILRGLDHDVDLIVTVAPGREKLIAEIRRDFPNADVEIFENRGRDVRPFLALLEQGRLDRYRYVCKIHGKKSHDGGRMAILGAIWRNRMLFDLLAAPHALNAIFDLFNRQPDVGMIGPAAYRYPNRLCSEELSWGENRPLALATAARMGIGADRFILDFFCGTMFWARPEALRPLRDLHLSGEFPEEAGKLDGALEHAVERLFSAAAVASGYKILGVEGFTAS